MIGASNFFEPAMCCSTGLCGVSVDPELLRISTVLNTLKERGIEAKRYNLRAFDDNWGLDDPTGKGDEAFKEVIERIRQDILELGNNLCPEGTQTKNRSSHWHCMETNLQNRRM